MSATLRWPGFRRCPTSALPLARVFAVLGCLDQEDRVAVERVRVGDTVLVHSHRPEYPGMVRMREVLRIGMVDGPPEYVFGDIRSIGIGQTGDLFVHDFGGGIRHFGHEGAFLGWFARQGEGPKEVKFVTAIDVSPSGIVAAQDLGNARIGIFYPDGSVSHVPGPNGRPAYSDSDALGFHRDETLWVKLNPMWPPPGGITHPRAIYARIDMASKTLSDTVSSPANAAEECPTLTEHPFMEGVWEPWVPKTLWAPNLTLPPDSFRGRLHAGSAGVPHSGS